MYGKMETSDYFLYIIVVLTLGGFIIIIIMLMITPGSPWSYKCSSNKECLSTETCSNGVCKLLVSQKCNYNEECESNLCSDGVCALNSNIDSAPVKKFPTRETKDIKITQTKIIYPDINVSGFDYVYQLNSPCIEFEETPENSNTPIPYSYDTDGSDCSTNYDLRIDNSVIEPFEQSAGGCHYPTTEDSGVIDVINYSDSVIYLYSDGRIKKRGQFVTSGYKFSSFVVYDGYLIGLSKGKLYKLLTETYENSEWKFKSLVLTNDEIMRIRATLDGNYLSVQTNDKLMIFGISGSRETMSYNVNSKRVYGYSIDKYIDIDVLKKRGVDYSNKVYENIVDAVIDYNGNIRVLSVEFALKNSYSAMRIVNWEPYFLRNL